MNNSPLFLISLLFKVNKTVFPRGRNLFPPDDVNYLALQGRKKTHAVVNLSGIRDDEFCLALFVIIA